MLVFGILRQIIIETNIHFDSVGSGYQIFKYPDIAVTVNVSYGSTNVGVINNPYRKRRNCRFLSL